MLIFDLDGTLIDSRRDIAEACNHALAVLGRAKLDVDRVGTFVGDGARKLIARALQSSDEALIDRGLEVFLAYYLEHPIAHTKPMPGAIEALDALSGSGFELAVATNKKREVADLVLRSLGMRDRFAVLWGGGDGIPKPDPACVHSIAKQAGVPLSDVWMIGDGTQDIGAGKAAGVRTIAVLGGFHDSEKLLALSPDFVVKDLREVPAIVSASSGR